MPYAEKGLNSSKMCMDQHKFHVLIRTFFCCCFCSKIVNDYYNCSTRISKEKKKLKNSNSSNRSTLYLPWATFRFEMNIVCLSMCMCIRNCVYVCVFVSLSVYFFMFVLLLHVWFLATCVSSACA